MDAVVESVASLWQSALRGHLSQEQFSVEDAFDQLDVDESGYLDRYEVEQAIALLGAPVHTSMWLFYSYILYQKSKVSL